VAVGQARYAVPSGAVFASPSGSDANAGTLAKPVRTITRALALVPSGGTVVLRAGTFHEQVTVSKNGVTIQNYPGEAVWLDGSSPVTSWVRHYQVWKVRGWSARFDASPSFTKGGKDGTSAGWQFVNSSYPMAAHPDMVFRDGSPMRQVRYKSQVAANSNTFWLDTATSTMYIGKSPVGHAMRGATLAKAISVRAADVTLRGFGVRRFGNSIWHIGAVTLEGARNRMSNMWVEQNATIGVGAITADATFDHVTIRRNGLLGIHAATSDRLRVLDSALTGNNTERFNTAPVSGGIKVGRLRTVTVANSNLSGNAGPGFWADQSVYDSRLFGNNIDGNTGAGIFLEISAVGTLVDNLVTRNKGNGVKVNNTSDVRIWNNTFVANNRNVNIVADSRLASNTSWGHDPRYPNDPTMTWVLGPVELANNVIGQLVSGNCLLCVEDYTFTRSAEQIGVESTANLYNRPGTSPQWTHVWSSGDTNPDVYTSLKRFQSATGQDGRSIGYDGSTAATTSGVLSSTARTAGNDAAVGLPSDLASAVGRASGTRWMGVWGR
jgi:parallel beta-helix repeat protein